MFPRIEYLEWISGRADGVDHDLGSSDLGSSHGGVVPEPLRDGPDPPDGVSLEGLIAEQYPADVTADRVLVTAGATGANFLAAAVAVDCGDDILVEDPGYEPLVATPRGLDANVRRFPRPAADAYRLDPDRIVDAATADTALIAATNRHNPSGRLTGRATLREAAAAVGDRGARLLVDEVYAPFVAEPDRSDGTAFGGVTAAGVDHTVAVGSLTKFHGLGGLRIGWLIADEAFVERATSVGFHVPSVATPSRELARRALFDVDALNERSRSRIASNHDRLASFVADRDDLDGFVAPDSTIAFLAHREAGGDAVVEAALDAGILVIPGRFFGEPSGFRISVAREPDTVEEGLAAFGAVFDDL